MTLDKYIIDSVDKMEGKVAAMQSTLERIEIIEDKLRRTESLLVFIVGYLLSPTNGKYGSTGKKEACIAMMKKWYYGARRSKRVSLAAAEMDKLDLSELDKESVL